MTILIRPALAEDRPKIWGILEPVIRAGETYALPRDMTEAAALGYWMAPAMETFAAVADGEIIGTYYIRSNQPGGGAHVANCGYVTAQHQAGRGVAGAMCEHSLEIARSRGFRAMQFNFVIASNTRAIRLWEKFGFQTIGRLPGAFLHPRLGYTDAIIMFRTFASAERDNSTGLFPEAAKVFRKNSE
jgi:ribosomal protein S18 acetylase RimI-like enzyme